MSRLKRNRNIDSLILGIQAITTLNQCSLSETDLNVLNEITANLLNLKKKKGLTNKQLKIHILEISSLLFDFFIN